MKESSYHYRYYSDRIFDLEVKKERLKFELKELEQQRIEAHEESMQQLKSNYEVRIKDQKEAYEKYKEEVDIILDHYGNRVAELEFKTSERKEEYQNILKEKPETLIKEIEQKFGFKYVE